MLNKVIMVIVALMLNVSLACNASATGTLKSKKVVVGYVEYISIPRMEKVLKAKMDTGAKTSSIHANVIEMKKRKKGDSDSGYVIFTVETDAGASKPIKKPITRIVRIKLKEGGFQRRPVVEMKFCIAGVMVLEEVNLSDREDFIYDVLIGRNMLIKGGLIVDAAKDLSVKPNCRDDDGVKAASVNR
jgi:hypothetical protein